MFLKPNHAASHMTHIFTITELFAYIPYHTLVSQLSSPKLGTIHTFASIRLGKRFGIILRGSAPSTSEYLEKSVMPQCLRRKSSSSSNWPDYYFRG